MYGLPISDLLWLATLIVMAGALTGFLAGLFGIGGGGLIVPVLYEVFRVMKVPEEFHMQLCIGTSMAIMVPTAIRSYWVHRSKGAVIPGLVRTWSLPSLLGVLLGSLVASVAPGQFLKMMFIFFSAFMAYRVFFGGDRWVIAKELPGLAALRIYGFVIGLFASLIGVSGGGFATLLMTLYGRPIQQAIATASGVGVTISLAGTVGYIYGGWRYGPELPAFTVGYVSILGFVLMAPLSSYFTQFGVRLAHGLPRRKLEIAFGVFTSLVGLRLLASMF